LSRFSRGNHVPPGNLSADIYLNGQLLRTGKIHFKAVKQEQSGVACFTPVDLLSFGLLVEKLGEENATWLADEVNRSDCRPLASVVPEAGYTFDFSEQRMELSIPQAYLMERPQDFIDPDEWDRGITAARLNYTLDAFNSRGEDYEQTQGFAHFESGFNAAGWRLRNISSLSKNKLKTDFQSQRTYAETDIQTLNSTLMLGQSYTDGQLFNAYGMQGAFLATDMRMLPGSMRSYAPLVQGVADSNAKVTIRQGGIVIYERAVPPGPFEINNLTVVGYGNDLNVMVSEADGSTKEFTVPYSPLVQLLRPGQFKYATNIGQAWSPSVNKYTPRVGQFTAQLGVNNYLTAYGGGLLSEDYNAVALGGAISTYLGGISVDYTRSHVALNSTGQVDGDSLRFIYSTLIEPTNTNITLSSYRHSSRGFWSFNEAVAAENYAARGDLSDASYRQINTYRDKQKGRFDISLRQYLAPGLGNVFVSGSMRNFWNRRGSQTQYQISYGNSFNKLDYELAANRVKDHYGQAYNEYRLSFSLPIFGADRGNRTYLSSSAWRHSDNGSQGQVQLSGITGSDQQLTYGVSTNQGLDSQNTQESYGLNGSYQGPGALVSGGISRGQGYQSAALGIAGSVVAHEGGINFGQTLGDTVGLVEAPHADGARITSVFGAKVDSNGFGVVPYLSAYSKNRIELDPEGLSNDVQLNETSIETVPVVGSIVRVQFQTTNEKTVLINSAFTDGTPLPFGAEVLDYTTRNSVGFVGQGGSIFARGVAAQGRLLVRLSERECVIDYSFDQQAFDARLPSLPGAMISTSAPCKL
jgi:outer membrane usher protein